MNKSKVCLTDKVCIPCRGDVPPLEISVINNLLAELGGVWIINKSGHLYREYHFDNFIDSMNFANQIALIAEKEAHHPNLEISWGKCAVEIWTHKINGLTESDFILAAKLDEL